MSENRRTGLTDEELEILAGKIADKMTQANQCSFTPSEQQALKDLVKTKRNAAKLFLWFFGALTLWVAYDIYQAIVSHIVWTK